MAAEPQPSVVFILADDLGWSDTTLYESTRFYKTPNIQRLAARGMTFIRAYSSSPLCSPTRLSILTGWSPARTNISAPVCHLPTVSLRASSTPTAAPNQKSTQPNSATRLSTDHYTLGKMFKANGYATGHFGKWHLGAESYSPLQHGFDVDLPHWPGPGRAGSYVAPWKFVDFDARTPDEHIEDRMADDAVGTLLDTRDRLQIADRTIIVLATDNGGNMYSEVDGTTATSNAPLRGGKATMYEGGIRGPAIVAYPAVLTPGSRSDEVIQSSDYCPTFLDLLAIEPQPGQRFDGISIMPALRGQKLGRQANFTYFPHAPAIPDWLPPSVSVHQGDWKLIRIFHGGEHQSHRHKLFNLRDDIGEQRDLAAAFPERVEAMNELIETFLVDTGAVCPLANPNFDPSKYQPELEGKGTLKRSADGPRGKASRSANLTANMGKAVAGWRPAGGCSIAIDDGAMVITSSGNDPHVIYQLSQPLPPGPLVLRFKMESDSSGKGQVFWHQQGIAPAFFSDRSIVFPVEHDGRTGDYVIALPAKGPGEIRMKDLSVTSEDGEEIHSWKF